MKINYYGVPKMCGCSAALGNNHPLDPMGLAIKEAAKKTNIVIDKLNVFRDYNTILKGKLPEYPGLVIDDKLIISGYEPDLKELKKIFKKLN